MFTAEEIDELNAKMQKILSRERFLHSIGVAYMAACLAPVWGGDIDKALVAGLLHDCAKEIPKAEQESMCDSCGITLRPVERAAKQLIHGRLGAYIAKNTYNIQDQDILNAIDNHTVGRPGMSTLEKIIFCADLIEPGRDYPSEPSLTELRQLIFLDLDKTTALILKHQLEYLKKQGQEIDTMTEETYNYYKNHITDGRNV